MTPTLSIAHKNEIARIFGHKRTDKRPTKDARFMRDAINAASMATCPRASVGCVFVRDGYGLVSGYNGAPRGMAHCIDEGCIMEAGHCIRALHAEQNAIIQAAWHGVSVARSTVYVTHYPCALCAKMLVNLGVVRVVYLQEYIPADGGDFLRLAGVPVERINIVTITEKIDYVIKRIKEGDKPILHVDNNETFFQFQDGTEIPLYDQDTIHALAGALDIEVPL